MIALDKLIQLLLVYKYIIIFPVAVFEGPIISIISGFLASQKVLNPFIASGVLILGDIIGDSLYYAIGRFGGERFIKKWGHIFGLTESRVEVMEKHFDKHAGKTLLFGKTQPYGSVIIAASGVVKTPFGKFIWYNLIGTVIKTAILVIIGYYFGQAYTAIDHYINFVGAILTAVAFVLIAGFIIYHKRYAQNRNSN